MSDDGSSWDFGEGEEIYPGRAALRRLGGGRRYEAYLAFDADLHAPVVVKIVRPDQVGDERAERGLAREIAALDRLDHPVIVRCFDAVTEGPRPHLVLEHLEGGRLSTLIRRYGPLAAEQLVPLAIQLASALHYMHGEEMVHLDVKPSNVIMSGPPRLIDLSVARTLEQAAALDRRSGSPAYMAPETCLPGELGAIGPPADVWCTGMTLYEALSGELPFPEPPAGARDPHARFPQLSKHPAPLEGGQAAVERAIMACLRSDPADRPSPAELAGEFESVLSGMPLPRVKRRR